MRKKNIISIIIPVFNQEKFIGRCLRSVLSQKIDRKNYEIIVINDGSKDNTLKILKAFGDEIIILHNKTNKGLPFSINKGIKKSQGEFIVRVDSDDYVNKNFLYILKLFLKENSKIDAVSCDYVLVDDKEKFLKRNNSEKNPVGCGIMFRTKHLLSIGMYDTKFLAHEDKELRLRFLKKYNIHRIPLALYRYRKHKKNITKNKKVMNLYFKKLRKKHKF
jgi:glycosyltransferase involved in cell wall biosynthesis